MSCLVYFIIRHITQKGCTHASTQVFTFLCSLRVWHNPTVTKLCCAVPNGSAKVSEDTFITSLKHKFNFTHFLYPYDILWYMRNSTEVSRLYLGLAKMGCLQAMRDIIRLQSNWFPLRCLWICSIITFFDFETTLNCSNMCVLTSDL
jgi:hypothetical protein